MRNDRFEMAIRHVLMALDVDPNTVVTIEIKGDDEATVIYKERGNPNKVLQTRTVPRRPQRQ